MKTTLTYTSLNTDVPWPAVLARQLDHWHSLTTITSAEVILDQPRDAKRAYRVKVRLDLPGPEMHTDASDATLEGALLMATQDLERQILARTTKPLCGSAACVPPAPFPEARPFVGLEGSRKRRRPI